MLNRFAISAVGVVLSSIALAGEPEMKIETREVKKQSTLVFKKTVKQEEIAKTIGENLPNVMMYVQSKQIKAVNPAPFARYTPSAKEGEMNMEAGWIVPDGSKGEGEIAASELPAGKVVFYLHTGPYEKLPEVWGKLKTAIEAKGMKSTRGGWEIYMTDPGTTKPEDSKTEIYVLLDEAK